MTEPRFMTEWEREEYERERRKTQESMQPDKDEEITALRHRIAELEAMIQGYRDEAAEYKMRVAELETQCPVCHSPHKWQDGDTCGVPTCPNKPTQELETLRDTLRRIANGHDNDFAKWANVIDRHLTVTAGMGETTSEHIARDMRSGIFPRRSEPLSVVDATVERCARWLDKNQDKIGGMLFPGEEMRSALDPEEKQ